MTIKEQADMGGWQTEEGATMVEYGFLLAGVALIVVVALLVLGPAISELYVDGANAFAP